MAEKYDRDLTDLFELQDEITHAIAGAIEPEILKFERDRIAERPPRSEDAYELYQRGMFHHYRQNKADNLEAQAYFRRALAIEPQYPQATAGLSIALSSAAMIGWADDPDARFADAYDLARQAVALDPRYPNAHFALGLACMWDAPFRARDHGLRGGHQAQPELCCCPVLLGQMYLYAGRREEAIAPAAGIWPSDTPPSGRRMGYRLPFQDPDCLDYYQRPDRSNRSLPTNYTHSGPKCYGFLYRDYQVPDPAKSTTTTPLVLGLSDLLPAMTPLAFISSSKGPAPVTRLYNPSANVFLYGVASEFTGQSGSEPDTVFFVCDDTSLTNGNLKQGSVVAEFSFPLVVLSGYPSTPTETVVPTTLQFRATSAGDCSASTVSGQSLDSHPSVSFSSLLASQIGIDCAVVFAPSPLSTKSHAIFEVAVQLVITQATDPLYIGSNLYSVIASPWQKLDVTGFPSGGFSGVKGIPDGSYIGLAPSAQPLGPPPP